MKILSLPASIVSPFRIIAVLALSLVIATILFATQAHAGPCNPPNIPNPEDAIDRINKCAIEKNVFDDKIFNLNQTAGTVDSLYNIITGSSNLHPTTNTVTQNSGALAATGNLVASLYGTPPASGIEYFAQKYRELNPVQPAYAATEPAGYAALRPAQKIWSVFRNISYIGFVIVFVIMGFMIMFRAHISPQAVATVQDSLPRIVIALVLVTFSYAIAGLLVDAMFLTLNIFIRALEGAGLVTGGDYVFRDSIFTVIFSSWTDVFETVFNAMDDLISNVLNLPFGLNSIVALFGGTLAGLVIGIALLFIMFKIFLMLLTAYAMILVLTMVAPFFFLVQSLPGRNGAGAWFKQIIANIAVFPTVAMMFIFAGVLGGIDNLGGKDNAVGAGDAGVFPLLSGGIDADAVGALVGIGILLLTPKAADLVKNAIGAKGPELGGGAMAGAAAGGAIVGAAASRGGKAMGDYANTKNPIARRLNVAKAKEQTTTSVAAYNKMDKDEKRDFHIMQGGGKTGP